MTTTSTLTPDQLAEEALRLSKMRQIVDLATALIQQSAMPRNEAETLVQAVRERILTLFPGSDETYEVVYSQQFKRIIDEFAVEPAPIILQFQPRNR